jgi:hypothetical protein
LPAAAASVTFALAASFALVAPSASAQTVDAQLEQSGNWAGYAAQSKTGEGFSSVSASWVQPAVSASSSDSYSAFWVGLGGDNQQSQALEQVGTSAQVVGGQTQYEAWYELVPDPETKLDLAIHPGDHISARVTVNGTNVTVSLSDETTGQSATKTFQMSNPDTSSAEWIAEAPSAQTQGGYQVLPLADFGKVSFTNASATAGGHTGSISDPDWDVQQIQLGSSSTGGFVGGGGFLSNAAGSNGQSSGGAAPGSLSSDGASFSVAYSSIGGSGDSGGSGNSNPGGSGGYGDPGGYGYSDGYGYGDPSGYGDGYAYVLPDGYIDGI